jgi:hypothetical protein
MKFNGKSVVYILSTILVLLGMAWSVVDTNENITHAPTVATPATGNVIPYNNHGKTVFITRKEHLLQAWGPIGWLIWHFTDQRGS